MYPETENKGVKKRKQQALCAEFKAWRKNRGLQQQAWMRLPEQRQRQKPDKCNEEWARKRDNY